MHCVSLSDAFKVGEVDFWIFWIFNFLHVDRQKNSKTKVEKEFFFFSCLPMRK
jgi:hypothetical protein